MTQRQATHRVEAGQGFVVYPNEEVSISSERRSVLNVTWVAFSGYLVERYLLRGKISVYEPLFFDTEEGELEQMFDKLLQTSTQLPNRYCKLMSLLYSIVGFLLDHTYRESQIVAATPEMYLVKALDPSMEFQSPIDGVRKQFPTLITETPPRF